MRPSPINMQVASTGTWTATTLLGVLAKSESKLSSKVAVCCSLKGPKLVMRHL